MFIVGENIDLINHFEFHVLKRLVRTPHCTLFLFAPRFATSVLLRLLVLDVCDRRIATTFWNELFLGVFLGYHYAVAFRWVDWTTSNKGLLIMIVHASNYAADTLPTTASAARSIMLLLNCLHLALGWQDLLTLFLPVEQVKDVDDVKVGDLRVLLRSPKACLVHVQKTNGEWRWWNRWDPLLMETSPERHGRFDSIRVI